MKRFAWIAAGLVLLGLARNARAEPPIAAEGMVDRAPPEELADFDIVGAVRVGWGYSRLMQSRVLSLSFEDELYVHRLSRSLSLGVVAGMDGQRSLAEGATPRSFLGTTLGTSLLFRPDPGGAAFVVAGTGAPLWHSSDEETSLIGFGVGARLEAWPFYQSAIEAVQCGRGTVATYVLSGLNGWVLARNDWVGRSGDSYAVGFGLELGRNFVLPVLGAALHGACAR